MGFAGRGSGQTSRCEPISEPFASFTTAAGGDVTHNPVADPGEDCINLAVTIGGGFAPRYFIMAMTGTSRYSPVSRVCCVRHAAMIVPSGQCSTGQTRVRGGGSCSGDKRCDGSRSSD